MDPLFYFYVLICFPFFLSGSVLASLFNLAAISSCRTLA
jgi:hypothetical protein